MPRPGSSTHRYAGLTLREAQAAFLADNGIRPDSYAAARWAPLRGLPLSLPNFAWRRRAIAHHDVHHILTGYACTATGEMEVAAWEFAAGRYRHASATLFCLPLVGMGAILFPKRVFGAFVRGRRSTTLYSQCLNGSLLGQTVGALRARSLRSAQDVTPRDLCAYVAVVSCSLSLMLAPIAAACACASLFFQ